MHDSTTPISQERIHHKLKDEIFNVQVVNNEWMCNVHTNTILEFYELTPSYEYYACPECGNYIKVD